MRWAKKFRRKTMSFKPEILLSSILGNVDDGDGRIYRDCAMNNPGPTCYILSTRTCICVGHDSSYVAFFSVVGDSK